jgi:hypothetical protein
MVYSRKKIIKPKSLLPDANVIIEAYELNVWHILMERVSILVPSIIATDETLFFYPEHQKIPDPINLRSLAEAKKIAIGEATTKEMEEIYSFFDQSFIGQLHEGEAEALALLSCRPDLDHHFCSSDAAAIRGFAMIGLSSRAISFERLLTAHGLQKNLKIQFQDSYLKENLKIGQQMRITGQGLAKKI